MGEPLAVAEGVQSPPSTTTKEGRTTIGDDEGSLASEEGDDGIGSIAVGVNVVFTPPLRDKEQQANNERLS